MVYDHIIEDWASLKFSLLRILSQVIEMMVILCCSSDGVHTVKCTTPREARNSWMIRKVVFSSANSDAIRSGITWGWWGGQKEAQMGNEMRRSRDKLANRIERCVAIFTGQKTRHLCYWWNERPSWWWWLWWAKSGSCHTQQKQITPSPPPD